MVTTLVSALAWMVIRQDLLKGIGREQLKNAHGFHK